MALAEDQRWLGGRFGIARKAAWLGTNLFGLQLALNQHRQSWTTTRSTACTVRVRLGWAHTWSLWRRQRSNAAGCCSDDDSK
jgi:hypothetical protein